MAEWVGIAVTAVVSLAALYFGNSLRPGNMTNPDGSALDPGELYTGLVNDTMDADYDTEGKLAWEITRPYPAIVTAVSGYLQTQDK